MASIKWLGGKVNIVLGNDISAVLQSVGVRTDCFDEGYLLVLSTWRCSQKQCHGEVISAGAHEVARREGKHRAEELVTALSKYF